MAPAETSPTSRSASARRRYGPFVAAVLLAVIVVEGFFVWRWIRVQGHLSAADAAVERMDYERAIVELAKATRWRSGDPALHLEMAKVYRRAGKADDCLAQLDEAKRCGADRELVEREEILMMAQGGYLARFDREIKAILDSVDDDSEASGVYESLARGYLASYRIAEAQRCVDFWLNWQPDLPAARFLRADVRYRVGRLEDAIDDYRFIVEKLPEHVESHRLLGMLLSESGDMDGARVQFLEVLELAPDSVETKLELAYCLRQLNEEDEAVELARQVIEQGDSLRKAAAMELLSSVAVQRERYDEAVEWLDKALRLAPPSADLCFAMGTALNFAGRTDEGKGYLDQAQQFREMDERVDQLLADLVDQPSSVELRFEMAQLMFRQGLDETGSMWLRTLLEIDPEHEPSHRLLAGYLASVGKRETAEMHRQRAEAIAAERAARGVGSGTVGPQPPPASPSGVPASSSADRSAG
ncbi:MAG TPA: tetratricopeptide repeat protein [Pirellulaceae bacterium]|nr:tetratricopeptide repeat protein [Pirellulaceae bacterium]